MKKTDWLKGMVLGFASLLLFGCGGGADNDDSAAPPRLPQSVVNDPLPSAEPMPMFVASGVGLASAPSHLYTIFPESGDIATDIGKIIEEGSGLEPALSDLAVTPGGLLFGCSYDTLYLINKQTAQATPIGPLGVGWVNALAFNKTEGFLYGATRDGKVLNINPNKPQDTAVLFQLPSGYGSSGDMVFSPDGTLYATLKLEGQEDDIIAVIDLDGRNIQPLNEGSGAGNIFGLSYFNGELYGLTAAKEPENGAIWRINLTTGEANFIENLPFSAFGSN
jgi:hypothetical protein